MSRIALLLPDLEVGGAQRVMLLLAREFVEHGHSVDLILLSPSGPLLSDIPKGVTIVYLEARAFGLGQLGFMASSVVRLAAWIKRETPDVLLSTITGANLVALLARKVSAISVRIVIREAVTLKNTSSIFRLQAMRWLYPQADAVIALSLFMREELIAKIGISSDRIKCIANPVDVEFICKQAGTPVDHPWLNDNRLQVVISVGRLIPQKDYLTLLRAFSLLPQKSLSRLIIVGEGPERETLEELAEDLGISDQVDLVGFDINPWRWVVRADLFVLSSRWEGHPNALLEALVLGKPVVVTNYDASVYDVLKVIPEPQRSVVNVGDENALVDAISKLVGKKGCNTDDYLSSARLESIAAYEDVIFK